LPPPEQSEGGTARAPQLSLLHRLRAIVGNGAAPPATPAGKPRKGAAASAAGPAADGSSAGASSGGEDDDEGQGSLKARPTGPLEALCHGSPSGHPALPDRLALHDAAALATLGLGLGTAEHVAGSGGGDGGGGGGGDALARAPPARLLSPLLLPDLHIGNGGLTLTHTAAGAARCRLMSAVLNRLTANALKGLPPAEQLRAGAAWPRFEVQLEEGGLWVDTVEALLEGLGGWGGGRGAEGPEGVRGGGAGAATGLCRRS
jgi:hypothetical protein